MTKEIVFPDGLAMYKRCKKAGFSGQQSERVIAELFQIESNMQSEANAKFSELNVKFNELNLKFNELIAKIEKLPTTADVKAVKVDIKAVEAKMEKLPTTADVEAAVAKSSEKRTIQVTTWQLAILLTFLTVMGGGFLALNG